MTDGMDALDPLSMLLDAALYAQSIKPEWAKAARRAVAEARSHQRSSAGNGEEWNPTIEQVNSACMWYRHDFGLLPPDKAAEVRTEARMWLRAWQKEVAGLRAVPQRVPDDEIDYDDPKFNQGVQHVVDLLSKTLGAEGWVAGDGSEDYDCDLEQTLFNILAAKGLYDKDEGEFASLAVSRPELGRTNLSRGIEDLKARLRDEPQGVRK